MQEKKCELWLCSSHLDSILDSKSHCIIIIIFSDLCIWFISCYPQNVLYFYLFIIIFVPYKYYL